MNRPSHSRRLFTCLLLFALFCGKVSAQGRVVINEYMPWTPAACGAAAEFVELLNFGPGPVNIGCYILTDGDYAITIPANTILQPGEFFVISGMDSIPYPCANIDSSIHSDLNWTTCNCTSGTIPTTGDGFLTDGGSANEQLVLMDPALNIVDAVARSLPVETAALITTSTAGASCLPRVFDLDLMTINYETIGESAGRGNSFARRLDGDCGWLKDPQQSGNATNNTPGDVSDVSYSFFYTNPLACPANGSIAVTVHANDYSNVFPMSYTLAFDTDEDGIFEVTDSYTTGTVSNPNIISLSGLVPGTYRLTVASVKGCYLHTFPFTILDCLDVLPLRLMDFSVQKSGHEIRCNWTIGNSEELARLVIERSADGHRFTPFALLQGPAAGTGSTWQYQYLFREEQTVQPYFRLSLVSRDSSVTLSSIEKINTPGSFQARVWPNPVSSVLFFRPDGLPDGPLNITIYNSQGQCVYRENRKQAPLGSPLTIPVSHWPAGIYRLQLQGEGQDRKTGYSFIKQ